MPSSRCFANTSIIAVLILGFAGVATAQMPSLGYSRPQGASTNTQTFTPQSPDIQAMPLDISALKKRAEKGDAKAELILGESYYVGANGLPQDDTQAAAWYRKAAEQGLAYAQYNLGLFYDVGRGVPQDSAQAAAWYRKAAAQGLPSAQYNLGLLYIHGNGVPQDSAQAAAWYRKAAVQGNPDAQYNLGVAYSRGAGVPQDDTQAYYWIYLASQGKLEGTEQVAIDKAREVAASYLTAAEISQVQGRAQKWLAAHPE